MMTIQQTAGAHRAPRTSRIRGHGEPRGSLMSRVVQRLHVRPHWPRRGMINRIGAPDLDLLTLARHQIQAQGLAEGVDLANPLSITADAVRGWVRVEFECPDDTERPDGSVLAAIIAQIAPALFATGRVVQLDLGLVDASALEGSQDARCDSTRWAIARPGDGDPC